MFKVLVLNIVFQGSEALFKVLLLAQIYLKETWLSYSWVYRKCSGIVERNLLVSGKIFQRDISVLSILKNHICYWLWRPKRLETAHILIFRGKVILQPPNWVCFPPGKSSFCRSSSRRGVLTWQRGKEKGENQGVRTRNAWWDKGREGGREGGGREGKRKKRHGWKITIERTFDYVDPYF